MPSVLKDHEIFSKPILITGATGFIGSHLCKKLVTAGCSVVGTTKRGNTTAIQSIIGKENFSLLKLDITNNEAVQSVFRKRNIKTVLHLAATLPGAHDLEDPLPIFFVNAQGTLNILNAALHNGAERIIYASTMSVYTDPPISIPVTENHPTSPSTLYGVTKLFGEQVCPPYSKDIIITILRYGGAFGLNQPGEKIVPNCMRRALRNEPLLIRGEGKQTTDFVYIDDLVEGTLLALTKRKDAIYNLGGGTEVSILEVVEKIKNLTSSQSPIQFAIENTDRPFRFCLDIQKAGRELGYSPRSFDEGLKQYYHEYLCAESQA